MNEVEVAIVGGGIVGTSAAAFLAEAGARVALFERERIAAAASGRNSGAIQDPFDLELLALHRDSVALYRDLALAFPDFPLAAEPAGLLLVDTDETAVEASFREAQALRPDLDPTRLSGADLRAVEPALADGLHACRLETGYPVPPAAATEAFAERARSAGARIEVGAPARLWVEDGNVRGLDMEGSWVGAGSVVVAAGPWTPGIVDPSGAWQPIRSVWGVNVEVALPRPPRAVVEEVGVETIGTRADAADETDVASIFSLITAAGTSSLGSTFLADEPDPRRLAPILVERARPFVPAAADARIVSVRACARPQSADGRPLVGRLPWLDGAIVAAGHGPWGISLGPATGRLVADLVLGRSVEVPAALRADRFPRR
ncbi:MAG TPA: FAD-dependent oxidoreductase [Candidatus Limnocylindrales bacterium]|nr:FAD-dependent oxidoreductase [Candidatus Limnocylindrales bacterium]